MRQLDIVLDPRRSSKTKDRYLLVLQSDHLIDLQSVVVAPVYERSAIDTFTKLSIQFSLDDSELVAQVHELAAIRRSDLGPAMMNLDSKRDNVIAALDLVFTGF